MNFKSIVMCLALISYHVFAQAVSFTKTRDEEIAELVENIHQQYSEFNKEDIYAEIENHHPGYITQRFSEAITQLNGSSDESVMQY